MIAASRKVTVTIGGSAYCLVTDEPDDVLASACVRINQLLSGAAGHGELARRDAFVMLQLAVEVVHLERASAEHVDRMHQLARTIEMCAPDSDQCA